MGVWRCDPKRRVTENHANIGQHLWPPSIFFLQLNPLNNSGLTNAVCRSIFYISTESEVVEVSNFGYISVIGVTASGCDVWAHLWLLSCSPAASANAETCEDPVRAWIGLATLNRSRALVLQLRHPGSYRPSQPIRLQYQSSPKIFPAPLADQLLADDIKFPVPQVQSTSESFAAFPHDPVFHSTQNRASQLSFRIQRVIPDLLKRYETLINPSPEFGWIPHSISNAAVGLLVLYMMVLLFLTLWKDVEWEHARESYSR